LRHTAVGLNFIDVYHRTGLYSVGGLPVTLGLEGAGEIDDRQAAAMMLQGLTAQYLLCGAAELFEVVLRAAVRIEVNQSYPLAEAARAHRDLKGRRTKGSSVLLP
jgi:NADPH:quinone reductase-like Zn-dependent oxidoreductase